MCNPNSIFTLLNVYYWSLRMANNLVLVISIGFKLNSNLNYSNLKNLLKYIFLSYLRFIITLFCCNFSVFNYLFTKHNDIPTFFNHLLGVAFLISDALYFYLAFMSIYALCFETDSLQNWSDNLICNDDKSRMNCP